MILENNVTIATYFKQMHECDANRTHEFNMTLIQLNIELCMNLHNNVLERIIDEKIYEMSLNSQLDYIRNQCIILALNEEL